MRRWRGLAKHTRTTSAAGVKGAGGRRRDLPQCRWVVAGPGRAHQNHKRRRCEGRRRDRRTRAGFEIDHSEPQARVWRSRGRPSPPAPRTPVGHQATKQPRNGNARQPQRAAARSRSQWNTQRSRAATTSATWTAFRAAPLRRLSPETTSTSPRLPSTAWS